MLQQVNSQNKCLDSHNYWHRMIQAGTNVRQMGSSHVHSQSKMLMQQKNNIFWTHIHHRPLS